ncbi:glycosyltransferase family 87 protein [Kineococcus sp. SYSU DK004]|uniref:glycosyltransferase family 87 protein n=1 Tax=Kineococcus sp. SYSU DK004 TaxID=3383125 RepID=UPI003D7EE8DE
MSPARAPRPSLLRWLPLVLALAWSGVVLATGVTTEAWQPGYDLAVYRDGARDLLAGADLYERRTGRGHAFVYPPLAALLMLPLLLLPPTAALVVWDVVLVLALLAAGGWLLRVAGLCARWRPAALALVVVSDPFRESLVLGQISPLVVLALVAGVVLAGRGRPRTGALLAGLAGAVKVTPALVVLLGAARGWRRFAGWTVAAGVLLTAAGVAASPSALRSYLLGALWDSSRVAAPDTISNNSLAGAFSRAGLGDGTATALGAGLSAVLVAVLVVLVVRAGHRTGRPGAGERALHLGLAVSLLTCLASPVTWTHHALAAPLAALALARHRPVVAGLAGVPWLLPVLQQADALGGVAGALLAQTRPLSLLVLLALTLRATALRPSVTTDG